MATVLSSDKETTMTAATENQPLLTIPAKWEFEYEYFAGATATRFFRELREQRRIMGTRCRRLRAGARPRACLLRRVLPARPTTGSRSARAGDVDAFTILATKFPGLPDPPRVIGYVTLDGASTALLNYVDGLDL